MYEEINKTISGILYCINCTTGNNESVSEYEANTVYTLAKAIETLKEVQDKLSS